MSSKHKIKNFINKLERKWSRENPNSLGEVSSFVLYTLDDSINFAENYFEDGKEKKEIVLYIMSTILDEIILKALPAYVLPFERIIRVFLIKIVFSISIDFIVKKYNESSWVWKGKESYE